MDDSMKDGLQERSAELSARAAALNAWHRERHGGGVTIEETERPAPSMSPHTCAR